MARTRSVETSRRKPAQRRSRERVELILQATGAVIRKEGVSGLTTSAIAKEASIPASAIYQYFDNSDAVLLTFIEKEFERIAVSIAEAVMALETVSFRTLLSAVMHGHSDYFQAHPETIPLWLEGRLNPVVAKTTSQHSGRLGRFLDSAARRAELIKPDTPDWAAEVAVRSFDRVFEFVFSTQRSDSERLEITEAFLDMIGTYGEINYVTKRGAEGIPSSEFIAALSDGVALEPADFWAGTPKKPA